MNHIFFGNELDIDVNQILFNRCLDVNDRSLRDITYTLGGKDKDGNKSIFNKEIVDENDLGCCEIDLSNLELEILIRNLPASEKSLIKDTIYGLTQNEIAAKYGISQTTVSQKLKKIRNKIDSNY